MIPEPVENHGVIGDLSTVALVSTSGAIDFMCFPEFDSPTVFAALLDPERGGHFALAPEVVCERPKQLYLPDSNILLTRFLFAEGVAEISDFMVVGEEDGLRALVRRAKTVRGRIRFQMVCAPRFDYARGDHRAEIRSEREVLFRSTDDRSALALYSEVPFSIEGRDAKATFWLGNGESASFVLAAPPVGQPAPFAAADYVSSSFKRTNDFWRNWISRSTYRGRWRENVNRSALTLKLLTSAKHGSIVASPTFGLPEKPGGTRNWDYRYTWIRDASFTLYALMRLGYTDEASDFMRWIEARIAELRPDGSLQVMYRIDGRPEIAEYALEHLAGYGNSRPVRIGNFAYRQLQLDMYGELLDSVYLYNKYGQPISHDLWTNMVRLINWVCAHWQEPDEGIWEVRGGRKEFALSRVMCWVAIDRAIRIAIKRSFPAPLVRWSEVRDAIYQDVFHSFWDWERQTFVQHKGAKTTDASTLLMPLVKFISPTDPRWLKTLQAIQQELLDDSLLFRYRPQHAAPDGLVGDEGTFNMCTFWYVEALARSGDVDQARFTFEKMLGYANHLGLYSEELGPRGEHLGNFPQAFSHLALISAAHCLDRAMDAAGRPR
jgi:GH15 family glucan-1,4-alpha-glucosidase